MNIAEFRIEPADYRIDQADLRFVRESVFVNEQHIPIEIEFDEIDRHCHHVIARDPMHQPIGTARLTPDGRIGRMAVLPSWRNQGVGKALLFALIDKARQQGHTVVTLNAQSDVSGFYEKFGFVKKGGEFSVAGIPHQPMQLSVKPFAAPARPVTVAREPSIEAVAFENLEAARQATLQLIVKARRQLCLVSRDLEPSLYGHNEIVQALKEFAIRSRDGCVQIILMDTALVRNTPHPLLDLAQRLPSTFQFRIPVEPEDLQYPSAYLINDRDGYLFRLLGERCTGVWSPALPARNRQFSEEFERLWQRSLPCVEFRALSL